MGKGETVKNLLDAVGVPGMDVFDGCSDVNEEFAKVKSFYKRRCLAVHPDKGGTAEVFREVNNAFETLRSMFEKGKIQSFKASQKTKTRKKKFPLVSSRLCNLTPNPRASVHSNNQVRSTTRPGGTTRLGASPARRTIGMRCKRKRRTILRTAWRSRRAAGRRATSPARGPRTTRTRSVLSTRTQSTRSRP